MIANEITKLAWAGLEMEAQKRPSIEEISTFAF